MAPSVSCCDELNESLLTLCGLMSEARDLRGIRDVLSLCTRPVGGSPHSL